MLTLLGLLLSKRSIVCSRSGNELHLMCAHHWIGFTPSVKIVILWDGMLQVGSWRLEDGRAVAEGRRAHICKSSPAATWLANNQNSEEKFNGICAYGPERFMLTAHLNTHWPRDTQVTEMGPISRRGEGCMGGREVTWMSNAGILNAIQNNDGKIWNKTLSYRSSYLFGPQKI